MNMCCTTCNQSQTNPSCPCCSEEPEEELIRCYDCDCEYPEYDMDDCSGVQLCPECTSIFKREIAIDYNEYDERRKRT
jgi:hypothetical protein